jgi:SAM-dependent methyltransferase
MAVDWEQQYRDGNTPWDKGEASPGLVEFLERTPLNGEILVPGCGSGRDVRAIAARGNNSVVGLDLAPTAITLAQAQPPVGNERYQLGDLFQSPVSWQNRFDWVVEHTCFCALDPHLRPQYVEAVARTLKPGGYLLAVFFLNPDIEGEGPPFGIAIPELDRLFASDFVLVQDWTPQRSYPRRVGRERMRLLQRSA